MTNEAPRAQLLVSGPQASYEAMVCDDKCNLSWVHVALCCQGLWKHMPSLTEMLIEGLRATREPGQQKTSKKGTNIQSNVSTVECIIF